MINPPISAIGRTHIGYSVKINEDRFIVKDLQNGGTLLAVADGLGGNVSGGYAADCIIDQLASINHIEPSEELTTLSTIVKGLDGNLDREKKNKPKLAGAGSTLVCALLRKDRVYWVHVGDSRLYLLRDGRLSKITEDQTLARFLIEERELTTEDAENHYSINVMDQYVGCGYVTPESGSIRVRSGDMVVLTTDGVHKPLASGDMETILCGTQSINLKAEQIIDAALEKEFQDNMTIVLANV